MPEDYWGGRGWAVDKARLRLDLYHLVAVVFASEHYHSGGSDGAPRLQADSNVAGGCYPSASLALLAADFERSELEHRLISVAITTRILLDQASPRPADAAVHCGALMDESEGRERPLTLREACNKIVHATRRDFLVDEVVDGIEYIVQLYGAQLGRNWKARLHILTFAEHIAAFTT